MEMSVTAFKVAMLVGSLRKGSFTRKVANALIELAPETLDCAIVEIGDLPLYNEDLDSAPPAAWTRLRKAIKASDAVLFLTPEYNRSVPGVLKNAIDVGSRPEGQSVFDGLPAGVVSVTPYKMGAFGANHHLRQSLVFLNMPAMQQPEAYVGGAGDLFDAKGKLKSDDSRRFLGGFIQAFARWVETVRRGDADQADFAAFLEQRQAAAAAYVSGDAGPLDRISARSGEASFFPPSGGSVRGAKAVSARYDKDVHLFQPGGHTAIKVLQSGAEGGIGFWTGFQEAQAKLAGNDKPVPMTLRITELFRHEEGGWKLVHRHADPAAEAKH
jgi:NAD(P)H-dependent FMN reductase/ketosteroid isomerase-like protein